MLILECLTIILLRNQGRFWKGMMVRASHFKLSFSIKLNVHYVLTDPNFNKSRAVLPSTSQRSSMSDSRHFCTTGLSDQVLRSVGTLNGLKQPSASMCSTVLLLLSTAERSAPLSNKHIMTPKFEGLRRRSICNGVLPPTSLNRHIGSRVY